MYTQVIHEGPLEQRGMSILEARLRWWKASSWQGCLEYPSPCNDWCLTSVPMFVSDIAHLFFNQKYGVSWLKNGTLSQSLTNQGMSIQFLHWVPPGDQPRYFGSVKFCCFQTSSVSKEVNLTPVTTGHNSCLNPTVREKRWIVVLSIPPKKNRKAFHLFAG